MTNQPTEHARSGHALDLRGSGAGRTVRAIVALLGLLAIASTATAAEVVEVRVGRHPEFTRVVFELDRAAGYRIERSDPSSKNAELIVSLEAGSIPRRIQSSKSFIEQVVVEPSGGRSIARIRLAQGGLKLKEMILASPPRIVLDVISDGPAPSGVTTAAAPKTTAVAQSTTPAKSTTPSTPSTVAPSAPKTSLAANAAPATKPAPSSAQPAPTAKPSNVVPAPTPATKVLASTGSSSGSGATASAATSPSAANAPASATPPTTPPTTPPNTPSNTPPTPPSTTLAQNDAGSAPSEWSDGSNGMPDSGSPAAADAAAGGMAGGLDAAAADTPAAADAAARAGERPMMVKTEDDGTGEGGGLLDWALVGLGAAVVAFGGLVIARRRRAAALGDDDEAGMAEDGADDEEATSPFAAAEENDDEESEDEEEDEEHTQPAASSNPFAGLSGGGASGGDTARDAGRPMRGKERPADRMTNDKQEKKPSESLLFDDAEETKMEGMEVISRSQASELGGAMPMMGAGSDELTQMFREMQRRVAALESRIDELVDARDRLERQVAAQTEELRVQRAAIARTQRAVRNLARPEDGGDDEPTEPALREPN